MLTLEIFISGQWSNYLFIKNWPRGKGVKNWPPGEHGEDETDLCPALTLQEDWTGQTNKYFQTFKHFNQKLHDLSYFFSFIFSGNVRTSACKGM